MLNVAVFLARLIDFVQTIIDRAEGNVVLVYRNGLQRRQAVECICANIRNVLRNIQVLDRRSTAECKVTDHGQRFGEGDSLVFNNAKRFKCAASFKCADTNRLKRRTLCKRNGRELCALVKCMRFNGCYGRRNVHLLELSNYLLFTLFKRSAEHVVSNYRNAFGERKFGQGRASAECVMTDLLHLLRQRDLIERVVIEERFFTDKVKRLERDHARQSGTVSKCTLTNTVHVLGNGDCGKGSAAFKCVWINKLGIGMNVAGCDAIVHSSDKDRICIAGGGQIENVATYIKR